MSSEVIYQREYNLSFVYLLNCYRITISVVGSKTRGVKVEPGRMWPPHMECVLVFYFSLVKIVCIRWYEWNM